MGFVLMYQIRSDPPSSNWSPYKKRGIWPQRHAQRENTQGEAEIGVSRHRGWYRKGIWTAADRRRGRGTPGRLEADKRPEGRERGPPVPQPVSSDK